MKNFFKKNANFSCIFYFTSPKNSFFAQNFAKHHIYCISFVNKILVLFTMSYHNSFEQMAVKT